MASGELKRILKEDVYVVMALCMERCPLGGGTTPDEPAKPEEFGVERAGAVFLDKNERVVAMDCTRRHENTSPVHAAARVIMKFPDKVKGCTVYMSRKPCSFCVKLLVQAEVWRIRFLPFPPEATPDGRYRDVDNAAGTENLLRICPVGMSVHVPEITEKHYESLESSVTKCKALVRTEQNFTEQFQKCYWSQKQEHDNSLGFKWVEYLKNDESKEERLRCSGLSDSVIDGWTNKNMTETAKWMALTTEQILPDDYELVPHKTEEGQAETSTYKPEQEFARHMSRMALIASRRTEDPNSSGVGVILTMKDEVLSVGLNAFPSKARCGDFTRDTPNPFLLHAEENALLLRNTREIDHETTTAYISDSGKNPCASCLTLLREAGVKFLVLSGRPDDEWKPLEGIKTFYFEAK